MLRKFFFVLLGLTLIVGLTNSTVSSTMAQVEKPPDNVYPTDQYFKMHEDAHLTNETYDPVTVLSTKTTSSTDEFGYFWDDSVPFSWIDATNGTDTGLNSTSYYATGPITLPFPFKFYENTYDKLWINPSGWITFSIQSTGVAMGPNSTLFPEPGEPTNMIAPLWSNYRLADSGTTNRVFYRNGGVAPNRYFVVEWNQVRYKYPPYSGDTIFTFEVILYENGDFWFQYQSIISNGGYYCSDIAIGIENANGYDGLSYLGNCKVPISGTAVKFTRPPDSARLQLLNPYHGTFALPNQNIQYLLEVVNSGTLGPDIYNLNSTSAWELVFKNKYGAVLKDTNSDGLIDTGAVAQGETYTIIAEVQAPIIINPSEQNNMFVTIQSTKDSSKSKVATIQTAVPVPFTQTFSEYGLGVNIVKPTQQIKNVFGDGYWGLDMAIAETPNQEFVYTWGNGRYLNDSYTIYVRELELTILDYLGRNTFPPVKLTDHSLSTISIYDDNPTIAVAPNGSIGIAWYRWQINSSGERNYNIYFAILDPSGNLSHGPINITNNNEWGAYNELNVRQVYSPSITTLTNNQFVITWNEGIEHLEDDWLRNIFFSIYDTNGAIQKASTKITNDDAEMYGDCTAPHVKGLSNGHFLITYSKFDIGAYSLDYLVLDSDGNVVKPTSYFFWDLGATIYGRSDIEEFSDGNIGIAWQTRDGINFTVLDDEYNKISDIETFSHPAMRYSTFLYENNFSLAADSTEHMAVTWSDPDLNNSRNLYYAMFNSDGSMQTPPMIFQTSKWQLLTGSQSFASTTHTINPTTSGVDTSIFSGSNLVAAPNGSVAIPIHFENTGSTTATEVIVTATFSDDLTYLGDSSDVTPTINSADSSSSKATNEYVWTFPMDMAFLGGGQFDIYVELGDVELRTVHPVTISISSSPTDAITSNNAYTTKIVATALVYLPYINK